MLSSLSRLIISSQKPCFRLTLRTTFIPPTPVTRGKYGTDQLEYAKSAISHSANWEWDTLRKKTLEIPGSVNLKNIDAVLLKVMVSSKNFDAALSYAEYLKESSNELSLGAINGLFVLYSEMADDSELSAEHKAFILDSYKELYSKYKVLDSTTSERMIHALCAIDEWKKAIKVLDDIKLSSKPSHSVYSIIIATLFKLNKKTEAMRLIQKSVSDNRPLMYKAYAAWINYILRKYKEKKTIIKYLEDVFLHVLNHSVTLTEKTARLLQETFENFNWDAQFTKIRKKDGLCMSCNQTLDCLKATDEEFLLLQNNVKEKLIVGSDLFLKTSPDELDRFLKFVRQTAPYDVVLDALNIAYVGRKGSIDRVTVLKFVVNYFKNQDKKILLLGRKHMLTWPRKQMQQIMSACSCFFTEDLSQDDPYFITAAILSGPQTDIVSKDLLRGHKFLLKDKNLPLIFRRWQWQHQWMVFINKSRRIIVQPPLAFTPSAQTKNGAWHLPFEKNDDHSIGQINDGTPDLSSWLCLRPKSPDK